MARGRCDRFEIVGVGTGLGLALAVAIGLGCGPGGDEGGAERAAAPAEAAQVEAAAAAAAEELEALAETAEEALDFDEPELDDVAAAVPDLPELELEEEPELADASQDFDDASEARTYVVKPGDTLRKIAGEVYGDPDAWPRLHEANRARVPEPHRMAVGTELVIP